MGTHPIFESDFDCLTEKMLRRATTTITQRCAPLATQPRWSGDYIHLSEASNGVVVIELDRPKALNALCDGLMTEVGKALDELVEVALLPPVPISKKCCHLNIHIGVGQFLGALDACRRKSKANHRRGKWLRFRWWLRIGNDVRHYVLLGKGRFWPARD